MPVRSSPDGGAGPVGLDAGVTSPGVDASVVSPGADASIAPPAIDAAGRADAGIAVSGLDGGVAPAADSAIQVDSAIRTDVGWYVSADAAAAVDGAMVSKQADASNSGSHGGGGCSFTRGLQPASPFAFALAVAAMMLTRLRRRR